MAEDTEEPVKADGPDMGALHKRYLQEIERYEGDAEKWARRGKKIVALYKDSANVEGKKKRYNILWSNVETLKPGPQGSAD
jgi:hypothetical protein